MVAGQKTSLGTSCVRGTASSYTYSDNVSQRYVCKVFNKKVLQTGHL